MTYLDRARAIPDYTGSERAKCQCLKENGVTDGALRRTNRGLGRAAAAPLRRDEQLAPHAGVEPVRLLQEMGDMQHFGS
jgi:hypothetical protein